MTETPLQVEVRRSVLEDILAHAREDLPNECCGLLVGSDGRIDRAERTRNLRASPTRYLIDPADHFATIRSARRDGLVVIGAYHSHPEAPPIPSATDLAEACGQDFLVVIASPAEAGETSDLVRAFRLVDTQFAPVALVFDQDKPGSI